MRRLTLGLTCIAGSLLAPATFTMRGAIEPAQVREAHATDLQARITLPDGETHSVKLDGVGCSISICSRSAIANTRFDTIASLKDTTASDALLIMRDGSERRISLLKDFRVLYFTNSFGAAGKLDLAKVKSIELLPEAR